MSGPKVAVVWRGDVAARRSFDPDTARLAPIFRALDAAGLRPEPCVYDEDFETEVRAQLLQCDAALVWVNPVAAGKSRDRLNRLLEDVERAGVLVSCRPSVISVMGVKSVLYRTRHLGWGSDVRLYETTEAFREGFPESLAQAGPRVLKPERGNDGLGVTKITAVGDRLEVEDAQGEGSMRILSFAELAAERSADFALGPLVDQAYLPRLPEGMIRCYMASDRLAGFGHHMVRALAAKDAGPGGPRLYSGANDARFQRLRRLIEGDWTPGLASTLGLAAADLPVIWDADFILGPRDATGRDTYVLCEINVSSVFPMPAEGPAALASVLRTRLGSPRL